MATYVPGSKQYLPDIKPFTPDYKFLSAALNVREDRYNSNWQATNDVYNKVVYADLSREDNKEQRDQYADNIAPALEKISGMDLSLAQNVQSAKAVFAPFFENKLIVKDMLKTANYQKQMSYAKRLEQSVDFDQRDMFWDDGVKELQYRMQDFIEMSPEDALNAKMYTYTPDADLGKMAEKMLGEMKPPLKIKYDHFGQNPDGSINGDWIITTTNGEVVTGPALAAIEERLGDDPRVKNAYRTQAYVTGRDFAAEGMAEGAFQTVQEGQQAWATETISRIEANNNRNINSGTKKLAKQQQSTVRWGNYQQINGIIPESNTEKLMQKNLNAYESTKAILQRQLKVKDVAALSSPDLESTLNRAYQLLQMTNMRSDMVKAAEAFSMRDMESTMRETKAAGDRRKFKFDSALEDRRSKNRFDLQAQKTFDDYNLAVLKGEVANPDDPILDSLTNETVNFGNKNAGTFNLKDEEDVYDASTDQFLKRNEMDTQFQIDAIMAFVDATNPSIGQTQSTTSIGDNSYTSSELRVFLNQQSESGKEIIDDLYEKYQKSALNREEMMENYPTFTGTNNNYNNLAGKFNNTTRSINATRVSQIAARKIQKDAYDQSKELLTGRPKEDVDATIKAGFGDIWEKGESGLDVMLTKKEYLLKSIEKARAGELTNPDLWGYDGGKTSNNDYMIDAYRIETFESRNAGGPYTVVRNIPLYKADGSPEKMIDEQAVASDSNKAYEILQTVQNNALKGTYPGIRTATFNSIHQRQGNTTGALVNYGVTEANIDAEINNPKTDILYANFINQKKSLEAKGKNPIFYISDLNNSNKEGDVSKLVLDGFNADILSYRSNDNTSTNVKETPRGKIVYGAVYGDSENKLSELGMDKGAFYTFFPNDEYFVSKVKGGAGDNQFAGLTGPERLNIQKNGITMVFPQNEDISSGSFSNQTERFSPIGIQIEAGEGYFQEKIVDAQSNIAGTISFTKNSLLNYTMNFEEYTYRSSEEVSGGDFIPNGVVSRQVKINPKINPEQQDSVLEKMYNDALQEINDIGKVNSKAFLRDLAINGVQNNTPAK